MADHLKFDNMKKNSAVNEEDAGFKGDFIRKGKVGDFKNYFTEENITKWNCWIDQQVFAENIDSYTVKRLKGII